LRGLRSTSRVRLKGLECSCSGSSLSSPRTDEELRLRRNRRGRQAPAVEFHSKYGFVELVAVEGASDARPAPRPCFYRCVRSWRPARAPTEVAGAGCMCPRIIEAHLEAEQQAGGFAADASRTSVEVARRAAAQLFCCSRRAVTAIICSSRVMDSGASFSSSKGGSSLRMIERFSFPCLRASTP
jgi:hypothetical protein